ncbi:putative GNAT family acetyltransferase [Myriangium duriaei CBS 260.36]|uniref:GNAT family acetyltransferase n=1 Tax=Myriangium duriaei CBS 260.36 TaxID=1168546 RepID=A0A9P4J6C0_9PEZI|nr:putative GNAT family acetyltransferase [Myriangium duriaei CBS 260.36]
MPNTVWASDRLIYRAVENDDEAFMIEINAHETDYLNASPYLPRPIGKKSTEGALKWLQESLLGVIVCLPPEGVDAAAVSPAVLTDTNKDAAKDKPKPTPIGFISLSNSPPHFAHHRNTSMAITIASKYQGKGYGSEGIKWALEWAFMHANLHRVEIGAFEFNKGASALYKRLGFVYEGTKRKHFWANGRYVDAIELAMLDEEWFARYGPKNQEA